MFLSHRCVFQRTFGSPLVPGPSPGMQPVALQSLSELERASLQELALFQLQQRLPVGHLSLDRGTGGEEGQDGRGQGRRLLPRGAETEPFMLLTRTPQPGMMVMEGHL